MSNPQSSSSTLTITTVGDLRQYLKETKAGWQPAANLPDDAPLQKHSTGGDRSRLQPASSTPSVDFGPITAARSGNPILELRREAFRTGKTQSLPTQLAHPAIGSLQLAPQDAMPALSTSVDWRTRNGGTWLASIQNQGPCGCCWAMSSTALVESMTRIEHALWAKRSEGDVRDGWSATWNPPPPDICKHGAGVQDALAWIASAGVADPECYAFVTHDQTYAPTADRAGRTVKMPPVTSVGSTADAKKWLDQVGPLSAPIDAWQSFMNFGTGIWKRDTTVDIQGPDKETPPITWPQGHDVLLVGYDDTQQCWIIRNSWDTGWGDQGYARIAYGEPALEQYTMYGVQLTNPDPWTRRRLHSGCFIESGNGPDHRNFEALLALAGDVRHVWREGGDNNNFNWTDAGSILGGVTHGTNGLPAITATTFTRNLEGVYYDPRPTLGETDLLHHRFFDQTSQTWLDGGRFGPPDLAGYPGFIQSNYGAIGNFEVIVRTADGRLCHWWRDNTNFKWQEAVRFGANFLQSGPAFIQSHGGMGVAPGGFVAGKPGNFEVVAVRTDGTMEHWFRDNTQASLPWTSAGTFGSGIGNTPVCMIESTAGTTNEVSLGDFEVCVAAGGKAQHWWRNNSGDGQWRMSTTFGTNIEHVWGLLQSSWGNLEVIVELSSGQFQHYFRDATLTWTPGPILPFSPGKP